MALVHSILSLGKNVSKLLTFHFVVERKLTQNPEPDSDLDPRSPFIDGLGEKKGGGGTQFTLPLYLLKSTLLPGFLFHIIPSLLLPQLFPLISV